MDAFSITRKQVILLIILLILLFALPLALFLVQKQQDIRPRASEGEANLILSTSNSNPSVGEEFDVLVSLQLTDPSLRVSGVDFTLLYDREKLGPGIVSMTPSASPDDPSAPFTEAIIWRYGESFDDTYNFLRLSQIANKETDNLAGGTVSLATVKFKAKANGRGEIKFPDDNSYLEIIGVSVSDDTTPTITGSATTPSATPIATKSPTPTAEVCCVKKTVDEDDENGKDDGDEGYEKDAVNCSIYTSSESCRERRKCRWICSTTPRPTSPYNNKKPSLTPTPTLGTIDDITCYIRGGFCKDGCNVNESPIAQCKRRGLCCALRTLRRPSLTPRFNPTPTPKTVNEFVCRQQGGWCRNVCGENEEVISQCTGGKLCCASI